MLPSGLQLAFDLGPLCVTHTPVVIVVSRWISLVGMVSAANTVKVVTITMLLLMTLSFRLSLLLMYLLV